MPISLPPATPSRNDPATFSARMDAYLAWLSAAIPEMNSIATGSIDAGTFNTLVANAYTGAGRRSLGGLASAISGTANAIVLTQTGFGTLLVNQEVVFKATSANTGATTINLDGTGAIACVTPTGAALPSGYIRTDTITRARYNGTNWVVDREPEYGSGANGKWRRYADGRQTCTKTLTAQGPVSTVLGSIFQSGNISIGNWEKSFIAKPNMPAPLVYSAANAHAYWAQVQAPTAANGGIGNILRGATSAATDFVIDVFADGEWY